MLPSLTPPSRKRCLASRSDWTKLRNAQANRVSLAWFAFQINPFCVCFRSKLHFLQSLESLPSFQTVAALKIAGKARLLYATNHASWKNTCDGFIV